MQAAVTTYNGEKHIRSTWWYVIAGGIYALVIVLSLWTNNLFGVLLLILFLWWYLFYNFIDVNKVIIVQASPEGLRIHQKLYPWSQCPAYTIEYFPGSSYVKNIIFSVNHQNMVFTFADQPEQVIEFVETMRAYADLVDELPTTKVERWTRRLQI